jgi:hypothetical protein
MKKALSLFLFLVFFLLPMRGQDTLQLKYPHTVKLNLISALVFQKASLGYEYMINPRWSVLAGGGYKFGGKIPKALGLNDFVLTSNTSGIRGFTLNGVGRYHFKTCDCEVPTGLYAGVYATTTRHWGELAFLWWNGTEYVDVGGAGEIWEWGIGLQLGYQVVIRERFLLDFMFMGPRTSFQRLNMKLDSQFAAEVIPLIEEEINKRLDWWGLDPVSIPTDAELSVDFRFNNFRYAIGVGYRF